MKNLIFITLFIFTSCTAATTTQKTEMASELKDPPGTSTLPGKAKSCICARMWMPVCGDNGKTYGNSCEAECAGVKFTMGECLEKK